MNSLSGSDNNEKIFFVFVFLLKTNTLKYLYLKIFYRSFASSLSKVNFLVSSLIILVDVNARFLSNLTVTSSSLSLKSSGMFNTLHSFLPVVIYLYVFSDIHNSIETYA